MSDQEENVTEATEPTEGTAIPDENAEPLAASTPKPSVTATPSVNASPRAGGYIKGLPSAPNVTSSKSGNKTGSQTSMSVFYASRDRRINLLLEDSEWDLGEELDICGPDTLADNMLAVTISCVMLMAAEVEDISDEYLTYAENYLTCIKDDSDYHPPNVQGILNHITYLRDTLNRTRDRTKEICKCEDMNDGELCSAKVCAHRSTSKVKFKKNAFSNKSRCRIPIRKKSIVPVKLP